MIQMIYLSNIEKESLIALLDQEIKALGETSRFTQFPRLKTKLENSLKQKKGK